MKLAVAAALMIAMNATCRLKANSFTTEDTEDTEEKQTIP